MFQIKFDDAVRTQARKYVNENPSTLAIGDAYAEYFAREANRQLQRHAKTLADLKEKKVADKLMHTVSKRHHNDWEAGARWVLSECFMLSESGVSSSSPQPTPEAETYKARLDSAAKAMEEILNSVSDPTARGMVRRIAHAAAYYDVSEIHLVERATEETPNVQN